MNPFRYDEEVAFIDLGVPALVYHQRAWSPEDQGLLHLETGLWRADDEGTLAVTIALPRVAEVSEGRFDDGRIELSSLSVSRAKGGAGLVAVERSYRLSEDSLSYTIAMATDGVPMLSAHLVGDLRRVS